MTYPTKSDRRIVCEWLDQVRPEFQHQPAYGTAVWGGMWWIYVDESAARSHHYIWVSQRGDAANSVDEIFAAG